MEEAILTLRSSIKPSLKKATLIRGSCLGFIGITCWLFGALFLPLSVLANWGWLFLLIGGAFITFGLLPYRKLTRLENKPHEIIVTDLEELYFSMQGTLIFKVALDKIEELAYLDDDVRYGIGLWIKEPSKNLVILHPSLDLNSYLKDCQKRYFCDLYCPYFSKRSYQELEDLYKNR